MFHHQRPPALDSFQFLRFSPLLFLLVLPACRVTQPQLSITESAHLIVITALPGADLPLEASVEDGAIVCWRRVEGEPIPYITFQRRDDETAYGIYGLWRQKNGLSVDLPLDGEPIAYEDRDHTEVLAQLLVRSGLSEAEAWKHVVDYAGAWFAPGLRVMMVVDPTTTPAVVGTYVEPSGRATLVHFELTP